MLFMHDANHLVSSNRERRARTIGSGRGQAESRHRCEGLLSNEVTRGEKCDCGLFAVLRYDSEFCSALLEIENGVCRISLREKVLFRLQIDDPSAKACMRKKGGGVKCRDLLIFLPR